MKLFIFAALFATVVYCQNVTKGTGNATKEEVEDDILVVTSVKVEPFLMEKDGKLEGYIADLVSYIADMAGFKYNLQLVKDGKYGAEQEDGSFTGMIGEIVRSEADLAVAPLTITGKREQVVDFTKPFMATGIILVTATRTIGHNLSMFLLFKPFTLGVWFLFLFSMLLFGVCMFVMNLFNPNELKQAFSRGKASVKEAQNFNIPGSMWFAITTLTLQGYDKAPRSTGGRVLAAIWFLYLLFALVLYASAMVSIVNNAKPEVKVSPFADLDETQSSNYGFVAVAGGSTWQFFKDSNVEQYEDVYANLGKVSDVQEGFSKVRSGNYAFLGESPMMQKELNSAPCDLVKIGSFLDSKGYGIAVSKGSKYVDQVNLALLKLREDGTLQSLYNKWWKVDNTCPQLSQASDVYDAQTGTGTVIDEYRFAGPLIFLAVGIALSALVAAVEYFLYKRKTTPRHSKKEKLLEVEEGTALNETQPTVLESTRVDEVKEDEEKDQEEKKEDDVGKELEPEDKEEKEDTKEEDKKEESAEAKKEGD